MANKLFLTSRLPTTIYCTKAKGDIINAPSGTEIASKRRFPPTSAANFFPN
ncbi:9153_t:CDS:2, partial [Acaulospora colombiana]